jgi:hypothetical protein
VAPTSLGLGRTDAGALRAELRQPRAQTDAVKKDGPDRLRQGGRARAARHVARRIVGQSGGNNCDESHPAGASEGDGGGKDEACQGEVSALRRTRNIR